VQRIRSLPLQPSQFGAFEGKRRVASFGRRYDYREQRLQPAETVPDWIAREIARVEAFGACSPEQSGRSSLTEYEAGAGIGWHRDKPHFEEVFGLSLFSAYKFRFRRWTVGGWQRYTLGAEPRSLYRTARESRHVREHSISPVEQIRYSVTFRSMAREVIDAPR
jgi:alkylated DNA repair dioxygenase AlkB